MHLVSERTAQQTTPSQASISPEAAARLAAREKALEAKEASLKAAIASVHVFAAILGSRALVILAALASCSAWAYAMVAQPSYGILAAALVTAMIFWPALYIDRQGGS